MQPGSKHVEYPDRPMSLLKDWPASNSEVAALIRERDWSKHPLGNPDHWPLALKRATELILLSPAGMAILWGPEGFLFYNDGYAKIAGGRHPEIFGVRAVDAWPEAADFNRNVIKVGLSGGTLEFRDQYLSLNRGGAPEDTWFDLYYSPIPDDDGNPLGVLAVVAETTGRVVAERKRREAEDARRASEQRFRAAFANAATGVSITDLSGRFLEVNEAFCRITGRTAEELMRLDRGMITHPDDHERSAELFRQTTEREIPGFVLEKRYVRPDGSFVWVQNSVSLAPTADDLPPNVITIVEDITERKRAEEELLRSNEELQSFVYAASHDLREPVRTLTSFTQLLQRRYQGKLDADADEYMGHIVDASKRMTALISDLLAYTKAGRMEGLPMQPVELKDVGAAVANDLRMAVHESGAILDFGELPTVSANAQQIHQLLQNLIGNAIKYHRQGVAPVVRVSARDAGKEWVISVADNGMGFPPDQASRIFELFRRLHGREIPGTGIGLAICKRIVERHNGRIWAESEEGKGSTFYFTLPK